MKVFHPVIVPYVLCIMQVPAISGYLKGSKGLDGVIYNGFPGYAVGFLYSMIGLVVAFVLLFGFQYAINKIGKRND